jgi:hypothetical protein
MALGAERNDVLRLVIRHSLSMTLVGIVLGVAGLRRCRSLYRDWCSASIRWIR